MKRILVCGGRNFANPVAHDDSPENQKARKEYMWLQRQMSDIIDPMSENYDPEDNWLPSDITIISGHARGVDSAAEDWAICNFSQLEVYPADWKTHGNRAGPIRNQQMIDEGRPDLVIAFPGGIGTADMVRRAKRHYIKVMEIKYQEGE